MPQDPGRRDYAQRRGGGMVPEERAMGWGAKGSGSGVGRVGVRAERRARRGWLLDGAGVGGRAWVGADWRGRAGARGRGLTEVTKYHLVPNRTLIGGWPGTAHKRRIPHFYLAQKWV